ncbi:MAG: GNAT family N-acetyltransferase [Mycobacterium sp.]
MSSIRQATPQDADAIAELTRIAYTKWVPVIGGKPRPMTVDYRLAVTSHRFDLLLAEADLAGLIETVAEHDCLLIENVAVHPDFQGRGFGRALMAHAQRLAADAGLGRIRLYTNKMFDVNIQLYRSLGFVIDHEEALDDATLVHMSKGLS